MSDPIATLNDAILALRGGQAEQARGLARLIDPATAPGPVLIALTELWRQLGDVRLAAQAGERAIARAPSAAAWNNLGLARQAKGQIAAAQQAFAQALELEPDHVRARYNSARLHIHSGDLTTAETLLRALLAHQPGYQNARVALALIHRHRDQPASAADLLRAVLAADPGHRGARVQWASLRGQAPDGVAEAEAMLRQLLAEQPRDAQAWHALGKLLEQERRWGEALAAFTAGVAADPAHLALRAERENLRRELCDWRDWPRSLARLRRLSRQALAAGLPSPLSPMSSCRVPVAPAMQRAIAVRHAQGVATALGVAARRRPAVPVTDCAGPLRVGWLGHEFHYNVVGRLLAALLPAFDRQRVTTLGFAYEPAPAMADPLRARLVGACDAFVALSGLDDQAAAARIAAAGVQVLIDVNPYLPGGRPGIAAQRAAPVQVSYLSPITSGAPWIDYFITDPVATPPGAATHFTEALIHLPPSYLPSAGQVPIAAVAPTRAELGLPEGARVLASCNRQDKILPATFGRWLELLRLHPDTLLWLTAGPPEARANLRGWAKTRGIDPARLIFAEHEPDMARYLARLQHAELVLDTFPHGAHVTAADVLWAGVPLLTQAGATFASRVGASLLTALGLPELITHSAADYHERALHLLGQPAALGALRQRLAQARTAAPLFQPAILAGQLTRAWEQIWTRQLAGQAPAPLDLSQPAAPVYSGWELVHCEVIE